MKRAGFSHPKLTRLYRALEIDLAYARGIAESLWHITATHSPAGNVGKWTDQEIADLIGFIKCPGKQLVAALVDAGFLDRHEVHRLVVHDWPDHCENSVHAHLARGRQVFADGTEPKRSKLTALERARLDEQGSTAAKGSHQPPTAANGSQRQPAPAMAGARPKPAPQPRPAPGQRPATKSAAGRAGVLTNEGEPGSRRESIFAGVTVETLRDPAKLAEWFQHAATRPKPVLEASEANLLNVFACAERALEHGENPVALFASLIANADWAKLTQAQVERARKRLRALQDPKRADHPRRTSAEPNRLDQELAKLAREAGGGAT